jgi:hypothetical protein
MLIGVDFQLFIKKYALSVLQKKRFIIRMTKM